MALTFIDGLDYHQEKKGIHAPFCDNPKCRLHYEGVLSNESFLYMGMEKVTYTRRVWYKGLDKGNGGKKFYLCNACFNAIAMLTGMN